MQRSEPAWYRPRSYAHFDAAPRKSFAVAYASDSERVAHHAFWPLLSFVKRTPKFIRDASGIRRKAAPKERPISYAAHLDSHIYAKYAHELSHLLETLYQQEFGGSVLAYRKLDPPQNNITMAVAAFTEIATRGD